jgi:hypothetical protein
MKETFGLFVFFRYSAFLTLPLVHMIILQCLLLKINVVVVVVSVPGINVIRSRVEEQGPVCN